MESAAPPTRRLRRVLLVEDELDIQMVARLALEDIGSLEVEVCGSGNEALEIAPRFQPELILLDVMMPEPDGPATLEALARKPETASMPVVFVTAKAQSHEIEEYLALGAIDVIVKPFDPMTLADRVHEIWRRHHGVDEGR
ncbi:MAG: response regulator [bacterium]|nr:response regulator [bacterium]